jgi:hypothetical protein
MSYFELKSLNSQVRHGLALTALLCAGGRWANAAPSYSAAIFATGNGVGATAPDSVTAGGGSIWVEYGNGANSSNYTGTSTIVRYSPAGAVLDTYKLPGSVDGLKYNANTGQVWALQNQDGNSQLSVIDPVSKIVTTYSYGASYSNPSTRGFDDAAFIGIKVFLSETNPAAASDPVIVALNSATPGSPINFSTVLSGINVLATDPDSLKSTPTGGLILTGEGDGVLTFISNPGLATQSASSLLLSGAGGATIGKPDDSVYATATAGVFYVADTAANTVYAISASGLTANSSLFVSVGNGFGAVDPNTGIVTTILSGSGLHGADFVAAPEPATAGTMVLFFLALAGAAFRRKRADWRSR